MTRLILIRHGETDDNLQKRYSGARNPSLNQKGLWQAGRLAERLKDVRVDKVYSSDLKRAYETARIVFPQHAIEKTKDFREMNLGIFEGLQYKDIMEKYPDLYKGWIESPYDIKIPDGEDLKEVSQRVEKELSSILVLHDDKTVAVVAHGGPARIILYRASGNNQRNFWQIEQDNGALNIIDYPREAEPVVVKTNDISHLKLLVHK